MCVGLYADNDYTAMTTSIEIQVLTQLIIYNDHNYIGVHRYTHENNYAKSGTVSSSCKKRLLRLPRKKKRLDKVRAILLH